MTALQQEINKQRELEEQVETLIDAHGVSSMLNAMANVCFEKAQHIEENWQDGKLASSWERNGAKISRIILV